MSVCFFQVIDMKEARIDAILQSIIKTLLVYLPELAVEPSVFYEENLTRRDEIGENDLHMCCFAYNLDLLFYIL